MFFFFFLTKDTNDWVGPPNNNGVTKEVTINADTTCGNGWVCEHRWRQIRSKYLLIFSKTKVTSNYLSIIVLTLYMILCF